MIIKISLLIAVFVTLIIIQYFVGVVMPSNGKIKSNTGYYVACIIQLILASYAGWIIYFVEYLDALGLLFFVITFYVFFNLKFRN